MKPEEKKEQELSSEDLEQTAGSAFRPILRVNEELSTSDLEKVSGGMTMKKPAKDGLKED